MRRYDFDAGNVHYVGHCKGVGPEIDTFLGPAVRKVTLCTRAPHPYRPLYGTIKKSTAPYKVHNKCLKYIKNCMLISCAAPLFTWH